MKLDHRIDRDTPDRAVADGAVAGQMAPLIGEPTAIPPRFVQHVGMNVDPALVWVLHDPVVLPGVVGMDLLEAHLRQ
jgi:hypothetical protein